MIRADLREQEAAQSRSTLGSPAYTVLSGIRDHPWMLPSMKRANPLLSARPRDTRDALISVGHRRWARKIDGIQFSNLKSGPNDELVYLAIQVTTARDPFPIWGKSVLPRNH